MITLYIKILSFSGGTRVISITLTPKAKLIFALRYSAITPTVSLLTRLFVIIRVIRLIRAR